MKLQDITFTVNLDGMDLNRYAKIINFINGECMGGIKTITYDPEGCFTIMNESKFHPDKIR